MKLLRKLETACKAAGAKIWTPSSSSTTSGNSAPQIEPPKLCGIEAGTMIRVAKAGKLVGWITSFLPGLGNVGKAIRGAAGVVQGHAEQEIELAAESKSTFEILVNLNRFLSVLRRVCSELAEDELEQLGVSAASTRIVDVCQEFAEAMVQKYGGNNENTKSSMVMMFFALAEANDAFAEEDGDGEEDEEDEESATASARLDLDFVKDVKDRCQRCMAEITFCVAATQVVLQQRQSTITNQEAFKVMQKLNEVLQLQRKMQGAVDPKALVEAVRLELVKHEGDTRQLLAGQGQLRDNLRLIREEARQAAQMQNQRDQQLLQEVQEMKRALQQLALQKQDSALSGAATAEQHGTPPSGRAGELLSRLKTLAWARSEGQAGVKKGKQKVGGGGQGSVVKGILINERGEEVEVAVKTAKGNEVERLLVEAFLMRCATTVPEGRRHVLYCYGVVPIQFRNEDDEWEWVYWLVLELALNSLHDVLHPEEGKEPAGGWVKERQTGWLLGLAAALDFVHRTLGVAHCDVKPANCLLFDSGRHLKLADFGSAYQARESRQTLRAATTRGAGFTELYAAPEQVRGEQPSTKADVWGFGMVAYEVMLGQRAWSNLAEARGALSGQRPDLGRLSRWNGEAVAGGLVELLGRCWALDPAQRPDMAHVLLLLGQHFSPADAEAEAEAKRKPEAEAEAKRKHALEEVKKKSPHVKTAADLEKPIPGNAKGDTPLHKCAREGDLKMVELCLSAGSPLNVGNNYGQTPLYNAAREGHLPVVERLLASNADVHKAENYGWTPLYIAAAVGQLRVVERLLASNADVDKAADSGRTPLLIAAAEGQLPVVERLLASNADVHKAETNGSAMTPLAAAAWNGHVEVVRVLLKADADKTAETKHGTALKLAQRFVRDKEKLAQLEDMLR